MQKPILVAKQLLKRAAASRIALAERRRTNSPSSWIGGENGKRSAL
jgi:hypothetical protein